MIGSGYYVDHVRTSKDNNILDTKQIETYRAVTLYAHCRVNLEGGVRCRYTCNIYNNEITLIYHGNKNFAMS